MTRFILVLAFATAFPWTANAALYVNASFTEQQTTNASSDSSFDLFSLSITGTSGASISVQSVKFTTPNIGIMFDTANAGPGINNGYAYAALPSTGITGTPAAAVVDGGFDLTVNFLGHDFGNVGDVFNFRTDVDNNNAIVRGYDVTGFYDPHSMKSTLVEVTYNGGLTLAFNLDTAAGTLVQFTETTGEVRNWYSGITGTSTAILPEPGSLVVWSLLGLTLGGAGWCRRRHPKK